MAARQDGAIVVRIDGSGPIAIACALLLLRQGFRPGEIGIALPAEAPPAWLARRALATSHGSWLTLGRILALPPAAPIRDMEVRIPGQPGVLRLAADEVGIPALGHVVAYGELVAALACAAAQAGLGAPLPPEAQAEVIVDARGDPGEAAEVRDFPQSALLTEVDAAGCAPDRALEWFSTAGPIALLPHTTAGRFSLVWCSAPADAGRRLELAPEAFAAELAATLAGSANGARSVPELRLAGERSVVALERKARRAVIAGNTVAIGNAAQALHPVGAQGLNLALRDAFVLAQVLGDTRAAGRPLITALVPYARARRLDRGAVVKATDALAGAFSWPLLQPLQSVALTALGVTPALRRALARAFLFGLR